MLDWLLIACALAVLTVGAIADIRTREVPDWINFAGVAAGLGIRVIWAAIAWDWRPLSDGLVGFGIALIIAYAMFYLGQWGGGDSKMLMALGALLGLRFEPDHLFVSFAASLLIVGGVYGMAWTAWVAMRHRRALRKPLALALRAAHRGPAIILTLLLSALFFMVALMVEWVRAPLLLLAVAGPALLYLGVVVRVIESVCMQRAVRPSQLTEGDWVVRDVIVRGRRICGPKDLGLTLAQIKTLKDLAAKDRIKTVLIKIGLPFVPAFFIAFLLALAWGNPLLLFL